MLTLGTFDPMTLWHQLHLLLVLLLTVDLLIVIHGAGFSSDVFPGESIFFILNLGEVRAEEAGSWEEEEEEEEGEKEEGGGGGPSTDLRPAHLTSLSVAPQPGALGQIRPWISSSHRPGLSPEEAVFLGSSRRLLTGGTRRVHSGAARRASGRSADTDPGTEAWSEGTSTERTRASESPTFISNYPEERAPRAAFTPGASGM